MQEFGVSWFEVYGTSKTNLKKTIQSIIRDIFVVENKF